MSRHTGFLISNLHCPSCVSSIENAFNALDPKPFSISHSIVLQRVTVTHPAALPVEVLTHTLEDEGYEVDSVIRDPLSATPTVIEGSAVTDADTNAPASGFGRYFSSESVASPEEKKRKRHRENCLQCQAKHESQPGKLSLDSVEIPKSVEDDGFVVVHSTSQVKQFEATLSIDGMTCNSCVQTVTRGLEEIPWVKSASVNLLTNSATVRFLGQHDQAAKLPEAIDGLGYDATIQHVEEEVKDHASQTATDVWKAIYHVGGMTCSSCVGNVSSALNEHPWIRSVDVNLIANNAVVVFEDKAHLDDIQHTIESIGYEAQLSELEDVGQHDQQPSQRSVSIRIDGLYCEHCPPRIMHAIANLDEEIHIDKAPTVHDPILQISYLPDTPRLTIRTILAAISAADQAFYPSIHHPMTIEERSNRMQARERRHLLLRLLLSITIAIPTLIIGIVYMALVPDSDPNRQYLMHPLHGVSRAEWALLVLATVVYFYGADIFHRRTLKELRALWRPGSPTPILRRFYRFGSMNMLLSLATTIAYFSSIAQLIIAATHPSDDTSTSSSSSSYFDSVIFLTMFLLAGRLIEAYSKAKTGDAIAKLGSLRPTEALLITSPQTTESDADANPESSLEKVTVDHLDSGDVVRVPHGSSPPCDGTVVAGTTQFDESSLTGESKPVTKSTSDAVYAGTTNQGGAISVRITGVAGSSMLDQIMKVVREGQTRRAPIERFADVLTGYFVPVVTVIAVLTWVTWLSLGLGGVLPPSYRDTDVGGWPFWSLQFAIAVFVIACPCGIGLAAPTALFVGGGLAAKHGILVKGGGEAFQEASKLDCIVFDKTGTLTQGGDPVLTDHQFFPLEKIGLERDTVLGVVKKLEEDSGHPVAKAVVSFCKSAQSAQSPSFETRDSSEVPGKGMKGSFTTATLPGKSIDVLVGNEALMADHNVDIDPSVARTLDFWKREAKSIILAATKVSTPDDTSPSNWTLAAIFSVSDPLRPEAPAVIAALQQRNISIWMLTGDNPTTASAVGSALNIPDSNIIAGVLPDQKASKILSLQRSTEPRGAGTDTEAARTVVAMVGDGINDSPALATADVGIAIGTGSDVAISSAKFVLVTSQLTALLNLIDLSRVVFRRIKFNFFWALVYNMIALPVAAGVLYPVVVGGGSGGGGGSHFRLDPVWAALAMALSSLSVVCSSLLLRSRVPGVGFRSQRELQ